MYTAFIPFDHLDRFDVLCGKNSSKDFYVNYFNDIKFYTAGGFGTLPLRCLLYTSLYCKANIDLMIATRTLSDYTNDQRLAISL